MSAAGLVEEVLTDLWATLLDAGEPHSGADFAALGGGPETARRLCELLDEELAVRVDPDRLLAARTLDGMAALVRTAMRGSPATDARAADAPHGTPHGPAPRGAADAPRPRPPMDRPPLSYAQQRLWFMQQLEPDSTLYNVPTALDLRGPLDRAALRRALDAVVARHEVLRTTYAAPSGVPHQVVNPPAPVPLAYSDVATAVDPAAEARRLAAAEAGRIFDLAADAPLAVRLVRLAEDRHRLLATFHHVAVDGVAVDVFYRELGVLYGGGRLPEPPLRYADFAAWQREWLDKETVDALVTHWRTVLGENPRALTLPTDRPRPAAKSFRGAVATRGIRPELVSTSREFGRRERASGNMTHLAVLYALLADWTGVGDITVGVPAAGRNRPGLEELVGCLINMVPVRVATDGTSGFRGLLGRVRHAVLDAAEHQDLPFDKLVEALVARRERDFMPVFRVMFSYLGPRTPPVFPGLDECRLDLTGPQDTAKYDISLYVRERADGGVTLTLEYDTDLFTAATAHDLLASYERALERLPALPDTPLPELAVGARVPTPVGGPTARGVSDRDR
ncbi:condensation domain-containing protein [Streptomyces alkaliterrae]|uniref:Condensation domain-containing protein n=1 Tax=Streptomyces alkaliterrae TaxID=2213162 RepID=A0A5P0YRZ1_9ACTN|nr:condensation domain-containing protein [Streptomyces alkaliterrae]MBB1257765.1 hypothetical protein [Streptomyces alkaliterrae]MQS01269.1 hypothetical protein [Streptomyces alkaliterrae]